MDKDIKTETNTEIKEAKETTITPETKINTDQVKNLKDLLAYIKKQFALNNREGTKQLFTQTDALNEEGECLVIGMYDKNDKFYITTKRQSVKEFKKFIEDFDKRLIFTAGDSAKIEKDCPANTQEIIDFYIGAVNKVYKPFYQFSDYLKNL